MQYHCRNLTFIYFRSDGIGISLRLFGKKCFAYHYSKRFGWFRIFGVGLKFRDTSVYPLLFGERNGYSKALTIGKWRIGVLKYDGI